MAKQPVVSRKLLLPLLTFAAAASACDQPALVDPVESGLDVPQSYVFDSRFVDGESSVAYPGQTVRNLLVQDLKILVGSLAQQGAKPITSQELLNLYHYQDALNLETLTTAGMPVKERRYSAIATEKNLTGKISNEVVIGFDKTADQLVRSWFEIIAKNSQTSKLGTPAVYTTADGLDLSQMIEKVLGGAVVYSQGTGKYLSDEVLFAADNSVAVEGKPYTKMEHMWDEAFGYFGAARDYARFSDVQLSGKSSDFSFDSSGDGAIDLQSEYNFSFARYAGKRDKSGVDVNFTNDLFQAFLEGRTAIVNGRPRQEIAPTRDAIVQAWEKLVAANVVHYANSTLKDMATVTAAQLLTKDNADLNKHWAEMRAFVVALQYNPFAAITDSQLAQLAQLMGTAPTYVLPGTAEHDVAVKKLNDAKALLQQVYGFSDANMAGW